MVLFNRLQPVLIAIMVDDVIYIGEGDLPNYSLVMWIVIMALVMYFVGYWL